MRIFAPFNADIACRFCSRLSGFPILTVSLSGLLMLQGCGNAQRGYRVDAPVTQQMSSNIVPLQYDSVTGFEKLNVVRRKHRLSAFKNDIRLQKAAQDYANLMGARGLYGHEIGPGTDFKSRIFAVGYNQSSGENIGVGYRSVDEALKGWMGSAGHKRNMLKRDYTLAGLAYGFNTSGKNPRYTHYWVLIMGKNDRRY